MSYDSRLAERLANVIASRSDMKQKKMFGGIAWLLNGNVCVGIHKEWLVIRIGIDRAGLVLKEPHAKPMDITGKPMKGWIMVSPDGLESDADLKRFVGMAIAFAQTLPPK